MDISKEAGCINDVCIDASKCQRRVVAENGTARVVKRFGGTPESRCGKFIPIKEQS